jgi:hypothetical protein
VLKKKRTKSQKKKKRKETVWKKKLQQKVFKCTQDQGKPSVFLEARKAEKTRQRRKITLKIPESRDKN